MAPCKCESIQCPMLPQPLQLQCLLFKSSAIQALDPNLRCDRQAFSAQGPQHSFKSRFPLSDSQGLLETGSWKLSVGAGIQEDAEFKVRSRGTLGADEWHRSLCGDRGQGSAGSESMDTRCGSVLQGPGNLNLCIVPFLGKVKPGKIIASAPSDNNLNRFKEAGMQITHSNRFVVENCTVLFLTVKPYILPEVMLNVFPFVTPAHIVISVAAGITVDTLENMLPAGCRMLRIMLNLPCEVQQGAMVFCCGTNAGKREATLLKNLMSACGLCEETPESYIDIHTGVSGSGVAYVYLFAEALVDGAIKMGMPYELSKKLVAQTLLGAAKMILETGEHPAKLKSDVCTPGGTTIHGLYQLEKGNLRSTVMNAVEAATSRSRELGKK
ncbi:pyrroline-5-carboxylate reductase 3 [Narcine bancroftii]|uniref:pyrroline-5-carboxylate reductase 3 n=1 Tax=Narcine bancroftii TaxID=1343680 RepID=UPI003831D9A1